MADNINVNDNGSPAASKALMFDEINTLNGTTGLSAIFAQRVKAGWGADSVFNDVSAATPMPSAMFFNGAAWNYANRAAIDLYYQGALASLSNALATQISVGGAAVALSNALPVVQSVGGSAIGASNPMPTQNQVSTNPNGLRFTCTQAAQQFPSALTPGGGFVLKGTPSNAVDFFIANSAANLSVAGSRYTVNPGEKVPLAAKNMNEWFYMSASGSPTIDVAAS